MLGLLEHRPEVPGDVFRDAKLLGFINIAHELVHLCEGHHGPEFWKALGRAMPDWQKRKDAIADKAKDYLVFGLPPGRASNGLGASGEQ